MRWLPFLFWCFLLKIYSSFSWRFFLIYSLKTWNLSTDLTLMYGFSFLMLFISAFSFLILNFFLLIWSWIKFCISLFLITFTSKELLLVLFRCMFFKIFLISGLLQVYWFNFLMLEYSLCFRIIKGVGRSFLFCTTMESLMLNLDPKLVVSTVVRTPVWSPFKESWDWDRNWREASMVGILESSQLMEGRCLE